MDVRFFTSAREFAELATPFLGGSAVENALPLSILRSLAEQKAGDSYLSLVAENGTPRLAAMMTRPFPMALSAGDKGAVPVLVDALIARQAAIPGVFGRADLAKIFSQSWQAGTGQQMRAGLAVGLHATRHAPPASTTPGRLRQAGREDLETVVSLSEAFVQDAHMTPADRVGVPAAAERRIAEAEAFLWDDRGVKSIAAYKESTSTGGRLLLVYTPPEYRGRGYASACVAALTRRRLESGWDWCALFVDTSDPVAGGLYRKLGFREVARFRNYVSAETA